ncbi:MAG: hypothetical protein JWO03_3462 [Bacteroidetes bacterium]|nr:hypothetical protein [Bacteroidota bacterium]
MKNILIIFLTTCLFGVVNAQVNNRVIDTCTNILNPKDPKQIKHFPWRLPDWIWNNGQLNPYITEDQKAEEIKKIEILRKWNQESYPSADSLEDVIAHDLGSKFSLIDLSRQGKNYMNVGNGFNLSLLLDPAFEVDFSQTINKAASAFLEIALSERVLQEAFDSAILELTPKTEMYEIATTSHKQKYTKAYLNEIRWRIKPSSIEGFKQQIKNALSTENGDPALLIITSGNMPPWWGWSYLNYFYDPNQSLKRLAPPHNYIYIEFNTDSFSTNKSVAFWTSKIAHELLHNLGYLHPVYKCPHERDINNIGKNKAFIIAYERAIWKRAKELNLE